MKSLSAYLAILPVYIFLGCQSANDARKLAPLLQGLGAHQHKISTQSVLAQRYFDQGMTLIYGFNHAEAIRSFQAALSLDPQCAILYWGIALASGPNINKTMDARAASDAYIAIQRALELQKNADARESALINALSKRYALNPAADQAVLNVDYAKAMYGVYKKYPDDPDIAAVFAESLMLLSPWDYWTLAGDPKTNTRQLVETLERALTQNPDHPGAIHYYIHAVEAAYPEKALRYADKLGAIAPGVGHLAHMPAHIYVVVGRYHDASVTTARGAEADEQYYQQCRKQGFEPADRDLRTAAACGYSGYYGQTYYPHNIHFLWYTTGLEGRSKASLAAADKFLAVVHPDKFRKYPAFEEFLPIRLFALARFAEWQQILDEPRPEALFQYATAIWHFARGLAYTKLNQSDAARKEQEQLRALRQKPVVMNQQLYSGASGGTILELADEVLSANIARALRKQNKMLVHFKKAIEIQDNLRFAEPPPWYFPVRQALGAALLETGKSKEAEIVYRQDLEKYPANGWSLHGLEKSLSAQNRKEEAMLVHEKFLLAWTHADVDLSQITP